MDCKTKPHIFKVPLTQGKFSIMDDITDYVFARAFKWHFADGYASGYAFLNGKMRRCKLHAFIMNPPDGFVVDHINGDPLDNRRSNLRLATHAQNTQNRKRRKTTTAGFKCVYKHPKCNSYQVRIRANGVIVNVGSFSNAVDAAKAYDAAAKRLHGEFARTNF